MMYRPVSPPTISDHRIKMRAQLLHDPATPDLRTAQVEFSYQPLDPAVL
jgi:hypothetical protein